MDIQLNPGEGRPLYVQLYDALRARMRSGALPAGARLPATRELAKSLRISRNTVEEAYEMLREEGLTEVLKGKGTFSRGVTAQPAIDLCIDWESHLSGAARSLADYRENHGRFALAGKEAISFASMAPDHHAFEGEEFRRALNDVLAREGNVLLSYGYARGYEPLRDYLSAYLTAKGFAMQGQSVLICDGFREGAGLILRALCDAGAAVAVENPTYNGFLGLLRALGLRAVGVPCDEDGMIPNELDALLGKERIALIYAVPTYHNPTGRNMPLTRRTQLLQVAARHGTPLLEDGFSEELRFAGESYPALKVLSPDVLYVGSFSKILFPGLRIGWLVVPTAMKNALEHLKYADNISSPPLTQAALYEYLRRGGLERHLRRSRPIYKSRMEAMNLALDMHFTGRATWERAQGGFGAWLSFPQGFDARAALAGAMRNGVLYAPGDAFYTQGEGSNHMRLGFSRLNEDAIAQGVQRLSAATKEAGY